MRKSDAILAAFVPFVLAAGLSTVDPAEARIVRRHLHCEVKTESTINIENLSPETEVSAVVRVTNPFSIVIPKGTTVNITVARKRYRFDSKTAIGRGQSLIFDGGDFRYSTKCSAWVPG